MQATITDEQTLTEPVTVDIAPANDTPPKGEYFCEVCSVAIEYRGRGRKPKRCAEHRRNQSSTPTNTRGSKSVDGLVEGIEGFYSMIGVGLTFMPNWSEDGMTITSQASILAQSWRPLLERDPKIRKMWEKMLTSSGWGGVIATHAMVFYPMMANHGLLPSGKKKS